MGCRGRGYSGKGKSTATGGGNGAALVDRRQQRGSGSLGRTDWSRKLLRRTPGGQGSPRSAGTEEIGVAARLTGGRFLRKIPVMQRFGARVPGSGSLPAAR
jgi:hypothetical protein